RELKLRYPDYLLLFRLGDFYETFFEDAEVAARLLQITLTSRQGAPMAGIPHHAADGYIARLVRAGRKIAISEQLEAPDKAKKLLKRDVVRIMTPGTITDTAYLAGAVNNFLLTVVGGRGPRPGLPPGHAGRGARAPPAPHAAHGGRRHGPRPDGGRDPRAPPGQRRGRSRIALRRARPDDDGDGSAAPPPLASPPAPRSRGGRRAPGRGRRAGRGARPARAAARPPPAHG